MTTQDKIENAKSGEKRFVGHGCAIHTKTNHAFESTEQINKILANNEQTTKERLLAAAHLGLMGTQDAEHALLENLDIEDAFVKLEVIKSLAMVGSSESLKCFKLAADELKDIDQQQLNFVRKVIAFRSGQADPNTTHESNWETQSLRLIEGEQISKIIENICGSNYGLALNPKLGFVFRCGNSTLSILLNNAMVSGSFVDSILSKPMIAGLLTTKEHEVQRHSVRYLLLTQPTESGFNISVNRTSGDIVFAGSATQESKNLRLNMRNVGIERTPTDIIGTITNDSVNLDLRTWNGKIPSKRTGNS